MGPRRAFRVSGASEKRSSVKIPGFRGKGAGGRGAVRLGRARLLWLCG